MRPLAWALCAALSAPASATNTRTPGAAPGVNAPLSGAQGAALLLQELIAPAAPTPILSVPPQLELANLVGPAPAPLAAAPPAAASLALPPAAVSVAVSESQRERIEAVLRHAAARDAGAAAGVPGGQTLPEGPQGKLRALEVFEQVFGQTPVEKIDRLSRESSPELDGMLARMWEMVQARGTEPEEATPDAVAAYLKALAPQTQAVADRVFEMDHRKPDSCTVCGPVSFGALGPLQAALRRRFRRGDIDVVLEPGVLAGPGQAMGHVMLKVVLRSSPIWAEPLAVIDLTASQRPENVRAAGFRPGETVVLPWRGDVGGTFASYPFAPMHPADRQDTIDRIRRVAEPSTSRAQQLRRELDAALGTSVPDPK